MGNDESSGMLHVLAENRRSCRICCDRDPNLIEYGSAFDFDPPVVSYWSQWLGNPKPKILIVGQDFSNVEYFKKVKGQPQPASETNANLREFLAQAGVPSSLPDNEVPVFLTNAILCLKTGPMNAPVK